MSELKDIIAANRLNPDSSGLYALHAWVVLHE